MLENIFELLENRKKTIIEVEDLVKEDTGDNFIYYKLILKDSLEEVEGKSKHFNPLLQRKEAYVSYDVTEICIFPDTFEKHKDDICKNFKVEDGKICGKYEGNLFFDVSDSGKVWLDDISLTARKRKNDAEKQINKFRRPLQ